MDRRHRAEHAERLLNDELFKETWEALRQHAVKSWETSKPEDVEVREDSWRTVRVLDSLKLAFEKYAKQGWVDEQIKRHKPIDIHPNP